MEDRGKKDGLIVFEISRMATINGPGFRTLIHFKGCSLNCFWCSTPESKDPAPSLQQTADKCIRCRSCLQVCKEGAISYIEEKGIRIDRGRCTSCMACAEVCWSGALSSCGRYYSVDELLDIAVRDKNLFDRSGGGVTLSGGEVLLQAGEAMTRFLTGLREAGISVGFDTAGCVRRSALESVLPFADFFLWDVKLLDPELHRKFTGRSNQLILDNLRFIDGKGPDIFLRCPIIPGVNNNQEYFTGLATLAGSLRSLREIHLFPFHRFGESRYERLGLSSPYREMPDIEDGYLYDRQEWLAGQGYRVKIVR